MLKPLYLQGSRGRLFAIYYPPAQERPMGGILYIHPFAEELNKTRRMAALQARRFADAGFAILMPDLYGCGDSSGDFSEARWDVWIRDLDLCWNWLRSQIDGYLCVWSLRLGAVLACEFSLHRFDINKLIFWQPVVNGQIALNQFLRIRVAAGMFVGAKETTTELRNLLSQGQQVEIAGYNLHPALAAAIDRAKLLRPKPSTGLTVDWYEIVVDENRPIPVSTQRIIEDWQAAGIGMHVQSIVGEPFWSTQEIAIVPALLDKTSANITK